MPETPQGQPTPEVKLLIRQLTPEAKQLIQGYMLTLVRPYGVFALAILTLIGSGAFWAIKLEQEGNRCQSICIHAAPKTISQGSWIT